jgi:transposase InsO family protein
MTGMSHYQWKFLLVVLAGWINRHQQDVIEYLLEEKRIQKELRGGKRLPFTDEHRRRLAAKAKAIGRGTLNTLDCIVTPDTLLRWYRNLIARKYDGSKQHGGPRIERKAKIVELLIRMAKENPSWGYTRLRDELQNLGLLVARSTVRRVLLDHGLEPAPRRTTWKEFLKSHWDQLAAADTFIVEVLTPRGLVRYSVLFVMHLATRKMNIAGVAPDPGEGWVKNVFRTQLDAMDGFLLGKRYLILDRDPIFSAAVRGLLKTAGVKPVRLPPQSPNLNAYAERFVRSIRSECLDRMIFFSEAALVRTIQQYAKHYHHERNHQGVGSRILEPGQEVGQEHGPIECRERVGGLLKYYYRRAA